MALKTYWWRHHQIRKESPKTQKNKKVAGSHEFGNSISCWWYLLEANFLCFYIVLWNWINSRCYENRSTFYSLVPGAKDKRTILTLISSWQFWVKLLFLLKNSKIKDGLGSKSYIFWNCTCVCTYVPNYVPFSETILNNEFYRSDFSFLCNVIFRELIGLENWQNFLNYHVFPLIPVGKNDPMGLNLWHFVDFVNLNMGPKLI